MCYFSSWLERKEYLCLRMKKLYLFNPENDMALASGSPYYMAPSSAKKMASDLAVLPAWYADAGSEILVSDSRQVDWLKNGCCLPLCVTGVLSVSDEHEEIVPWGWSPALKHRLGTRGVEEVDVETLRLLSSRMTAVNLLPRLRIEGTVGESFWLSSLENVIAFSVKHDRVLLKAPWSGSGKGIQPLSGLPDDNLKGWIRRIIASQGGVVAEPFYVKVKDFAMEFKVEGQDIAFVGYSLFETDARGIYKENFLASDVTIENSLSEYVSRDLLHAVRENLLRELVVVLGSNYQGYLGVDMMLVRCGEVYFVHPCIEVNLRMNMGVVSRLLFDRFIVPEAVGRYVIEYFPQKGEALRMHERLMAQHELVREGNFLRSGYLSLVPVFEDTNYLIYVVV